MAAQSVQALLDDLRLLGEDRYEVVEAVRALVRKLFATSSEEVKYGGILFGTDVQFGGVFAYRGHVSVEFSHGARIADPFGHLEGTGKGRRHVKLRSLGDITSKNLAEYLRLAHEAAGGAQPLVRGEARSSIRPRSPTPRAVTTKGIRKPDLSAVFAGLRKVMAPYAARLAPTRDDHEELYVDTRHIQKNRKPLFFGAVQIKKSYVSFHLMPIYVDPGLLATVSPELKARMQGKSCFNFAALEPARFKELAALTKAGYASYKAQGFVP